MRILQHLLLSGCHCTFSQFTTVIYSVVLNINQCMLMQMEQFVILLDQFFWSWWLVDYCSLHHHYVQHYNIFFVPLVISLSSTEEVEHK